MSTAENDPRPEDQREAANRAHLTPDTQADQAHDGTPNYGSFGHPDNQSAPAPRDGSNENPDEFSEFRKDGNKSVPKPDADVPGAYTTNSPDANPTGQPGHVRQNRDPQAVQYAQGDVPGQQQKEEDNTKQAWAQDDERYAGGHAEASWQENNDAEHDNK
jgi:hypothetical protein